MYLVAVDPGIRGCGVAVFYPSKELLRATYVKNPAPKGGEADSHTRSLMVGAVIEWLTEAAGVDMFEFVGELPQIYGSGDSQKNPNDLIQLAAIIGGLESSAVRSTTYSPHAWKGSVNADVMTDRIKDKLTPEEGARVERVGALDHNTFDAIGLGLKHLGRLERRRVIAR